MDKYNEPPRNRIKALEGLMQYMIDQQFTNHTQIYGLQVKLRQELQVIDERHQNELSKVATEYKASLLKICGGKLDE